MSSFEVLANSEAVSKGCIHWNFPNHALFSLDEPKTEKIITSLKARLTLNRDIILPMGYCGAWHTCLTDNELRNEVFWSMSNPWATGFRTIFSDNPAVHMPSQMDLLRPSTRSFYLESGFTWMIYPEQSMEEYQSQIHMSNIEILNNGSIYFIPMLRAQESVQAMNRVMKKISRKQSSPLAVVVDFIEGDSAAHLESFLNSLEKLNGAVSFEPITQWLLPEKREQLELKTKGHNPQFARRIPGTQFPVISPPNTPADQSLRMEGARLRFEMKNNGSWSNTDSLEQSILAKYAASTRVERAESPGMEHPGTTPADRTLIADMPGNVLLKERDFEAQFAGGRFTNIISASRSFLLGLPAESYISTKEGRYSCEESGTYSFEDENVRGLRETLLLETPLSITEGSIITDYLFIREFPYLFVSMDMTFPRFPEPVTIMNYSPMEIALFDFSQDDLLTCTGTYTDGSGYSVTFAPEESVHTLYGERLVFTKENKSFFIIFPPVRELPINSVDSRIKVLKGGDCRLYISPMGSYVPVSSRFLSDYSFHFTMMIGAGDTSTLRPESIPPAVIQDLQGSWSSKRKQ